jgi:hypothetical protein
MFKSLDLKRLEQRFMVPEAEAALVLNKLGQIMAPVSYSERQFNQTIYVNDDELSVPWGISLKARRYITKPDGTIIIGPSDLFNCELKWEETAGGAGRIKTKFSLTLPDFCLLAAKQLTDIIGQQVSLRPHILIQYRRCHFIPRDNAEMRVTADQEMEYGFFPLGQPMVRLGQEKGLRVEIKMDKNKNSSAYKEVVDLMCQRGAVPTISKKNQAYNFHAKYLDQFGTKLHKELAGTEIESKFSVSHPRPYAFFMELKKAFLRGEFPDFFLDPYPYTKAGTSINFYWTRLEKGKMVEGIKLLYRGQQFRIVTKAQTQILPDEFGLSCVMKRHEEKGERFDLSFENLKNVLAQYTEKFGQLTPQGHLLRSRLALWPENKKSGRVYHLNLDRCVKDDEVFYQLELEYVGRRPEVKQTNVDPERKIIKELCGLSWSVYLFANRQAQVLLPSQTTKLEWLTT